MNQTDVAHPPPALEMRGVVKAYAGVPVLQGINLQVAPGEVVAVIGPSGSGKSTLVRCLHQLTPIDAGAMFVAGELQGYALGADGRLRALPEPALARQRQRIGMVFQQFNLFPHLSALRNVMEGPMRVLGLNAAQAREQAETLLARVGLSDRQDAYPRQLSGGQQQRVAIARALAMQPQALLLDEPTSALDPELVGEVLQVVRDLAQEGLTMIIVTHEISFARDVADRVVFMEAGQIVEQGPARLTLAQPGTERLRAFLSRVDA